MITVSGAFITNGNTFLVMKRAKGALAGKWEFPGGKLEEGETENDAVVREIREELSLDVTPKETLGVFIHPYEKADIHLTLIKCEQNEPTQEIASDGSHTDFRWVEIGDCDEIDFAPLDRKIIEFLQKKNGLG